VQRAAAAYESGKLAAAQRLFEEALRRAVRPQWYFALGQVLRDRQSWTDSRKAFLLAALFGFRRQEMAYYQAARSAAEGGSAEKALSYLETALLAGLRPRARLLDDPALAGLHGREGYWSLLDLYFPPQRADSPSSAARAVPAEERAAVTADLSGNGVEELVLLFRFSRIAAPGRDAYYFALYRRAGTQWRLVNRTVSRLRSLPALGEHSALFERHDGAAGGEAVRPFIPLELDGRAGEELVVPSAGSGGKTAAKVLAWRRGRLDEIGEVPDFAGFRRRDGVVLLAGRGNEEEGGALYALRGGRLVRREAEERKEDS
jgi:hypothetical protein